MYTITTVYQRKDFDGLCEACMSRNKIYKGFKGIIKVFFTFLAFLFWLLGATSVISCFYLKSSLSYVSSFKIILTEIGFVTLYAVLGYYFFSKGHSSLQGKVMWHYYRERGERLVYTFSEECINFSKTDFQTRIDYHGIIRFCEDTDRFYLFTNPNTAHILPKRDMTGIDYDAFRSLITRSTGLQPEKI